MGLNSDMCVTLSSAFFFAASRASRFLALPSASAVAMATSISSSFFAKSSTICFCSPFVSRPLATIFSSSLLRCSILASTSTMLSYISCSCSVRVCCSHSMDSSISSADCMTFIRLSSDRFCEKDGVFIATRSWNSSSVHATHWYSGLVVPASPPAPPAPSPAASAAAALRSTFGKTWRYLRSWSVSCWYLYAPMHSLHALAPRSSSNPAPLSASVKCLSMSGSYLPRAFLPPPITNLHPTYVFADKVWPRHPVTRSWIQAGEKPARSYCSLRPLRALSLISSPSLLAISTEKGRSVDVRGAGRECPDRNRGLEESRERGDVQVCSK